jgi:hypothetical protein
VSLDVKWQGSGPLAPISNPVMADRGVNSADCHNENGCTADSQRQSQNLRSPCHRPQLYAWFSLGLREGVGNLLCI